MFLSLAVMEHPDAVAVASQMTQVYEEAGVPFEFPAFPAAPEGTLAVRLQTGPFSSGAHYGGSMMIRKSACQWGNSLPMTASFEDDLMAFYAWLQGNIYELPATFLYYYRFAFKNICAINSAARFAGMKTALAFEERERNVHLQLKKSKWTGLELCEDLLRSGNAVFRTRKELLAEIEERRRIVENIDHLLNWWNYPFRRRWELKGKGWMGMAHTLPQRLYLFCMVSFFKLRKVKKYLCGG